MTTQETALTVQEKEQVMQGYEPPQAIIARATEWANILTDIVHKQDMFQLIGDKEYIEYEGWSLIANFDGAEIVPEWTRPINDGEDIIGYLARTQLVKHSRVLGAGEMSCYFTEFPCRGKEGDDKHRAAMSAAQTWAGSKACRMRYSFVAKLAGFEPTPAEEMGGTSSQPAQDTSQHWCEEDKMPFARHERDGRVWYSHKRKDGSWHNEPEDKPEPPMGRATEAPKPQTKASLTSLSLADQEYFRTELEKVGLREDEGRKALGGSVQIWLTKNPNTTIQDAVKEVKVLSGIKD